MIRYLLVTYTIGFVLMSAIGIYHYGDFSRYFHAVLDWRLEAWIVFALVVPAIPAFIGYLTIPFWRD